MSNIGYIINLFLVTNIRNEFVHGWIYDPNCNVITNKLSILEKTSCEDIYYSVETLSILNIKADKTTKDKIKKHSNIFRFIHHINIILRPQNKKTTTRSQKIYFTLLNVGDHFLHSWKWSIYENSFISFYQIGESLCTNFLIFINFFSLNTSNQWSSWDPLIEQRE